MKADFQRLASESVWVPRAACYKAMSRNSWQRGATAYLEKSMLGLKNNPDVLLAIVELYSSKQIFRARGAAGTK
jgi:hypothetical protein